MPVAGQCQSGAEKERGDGGESEEIQGLGVEMMNPEVIGSSGRGVCQDGTDGGWRGDLVTREKKELVELGR